MKLPLSWLKDYVDISGINIETLSHQMTMAGLEVEEIHFVGMALPAGDKHDFAISGISWDEDLMVVAEITEVKGHPNADRLVLCELNDGKEHHTVLTGAPNLFEFKGIGPLETPLKVAYAKLGAVLYDGHKEGWELTKIKKSKIRGVESYSMVASEKELGISEEHEGIIMLPAEAPTGMSLAEYMGDAVLDIAITPNIARVANVLGVAREVAAIFKLPLKHPSYDFLAEGDAIEGQVNIEIHSPELNQRFVAGLVKNVEVKASPAWVQKRLRLIGQRPINNIVDVTNYVMFDIGQPLHAFDYDILVKRAGGKSPTISTRTAEQGEKITLLDGSEHNLDDTVVLVCDTAGAVSIAGIMGGAETEVHDGTKNVLLEGANWNYINIRKTLGKIRLHSEASYRFSRGMHTSMAGRGVSCGLEFMRAWSGGTIAQGLVDEYPISTPNPTTAIAISDVQRVLGIDLSLEEIAEMLSRLEFDCKIENEVVQVTMPDHRMDIDADPIIGRADLMEEIARIYGYENIPETRMADVLPTQRNNPELDFEENLKDVLVSLGLQEIITYRMTSPEREARRLPPGVVPDPMPYVEIVNPIAVDRYMMRKSLLSSVLENIENNLKNNNRMAIFEIGPIYLQSEEGSLPDEQSRLVISLTGPRSTGSWQPADAQQMDFYDLKGRVDALLESLQIGKIEYQKSKHPSLHPGKSADIYTGERRIGMIGELHPAVHAQHEFSNAPVLVAALNMDFLMELSAGRHGVDQVSVYPPILEDLALVVDENITAFSVEALIKQTGGKSLVDVSLFDVFVGEQIGTGKKSLAYNLTYQLPDRTLTDKEVSKTRNKIIKRLAHEIDAQLRS
jgi:phenylalanyl-tRNA synthetase beta chain